MCEPRWPFDSKRPSDGPLSTAPDVSYVVKDLDMRHPGCISGFFNSSNIKTSHSHPTQRVNPIPDSVASQLRRTRHPALIDAGISGHNRAAEGEILGMVTQNVEPSPGTDVTPI